MCTVTADESGEEILSGAFPGRTTDFISHSQRLSATGGVRHTVEKPVIVTFSETVKLPKKLCRTMSKTVSLSEKENCSVKTWESYCYKLKQVFMDSKSFIIIVQQK